MQNRGLIGRETLLWHVAFSLAGRVVGSVVEEGYVGLSVLISRTEQKPHVSCSTNRTPLERVRYPPRTRSVARSRWVGRSGTRFFRADHFESRSLV